MPGSRQGDAIDFAFYPHRNLQRSISERSPISPLQSGYGSATSPGSPHFRRKPTRSSVASLSSIEERQLLQPPEQSQNYTAYLPSGAVPRSAPPIQTSFPARQVLESPAWPYAIQPLEYLRPQYTTFSPVSSNPYDSWEHQRSPQRPRANASSYMTSPTVYSSYPPPDAFDSEFGSGRAWSGSSAPAAMKSPVPSTRAEGLPLRVSTTRAESNLRRQSEAVDEFTSPSEFALFVEATSSLSINTMMTSDWSSPRLHPTPPPPSRLLAPLPPLPYQQMRSHSSPATTNRQVARRPSRSQLVAEALTGLDHEDRMRPMAEVHRLDEDDLTLDENDDDLPDYAQSQAEASARQRREAARRAQELDEAWSRARRRRG
ncbi:hypothetical protein BLS_009213 [Venturia inaequalis]|uniref:Uncharacterized protein n=1 Tax=Venturia inaequalis TaxID=5025 RepID=A0A8H3ZB37_VENIN|nr:hypothetical protein BLS_009213 [Venturia inaequalis]KAE9992950.1 hypothetical protein EG327_007258 [Venturia inaequalis]